MKIEHIAIYVRDLNIAKKFYETYFNAKSTSLYHNKNTGFKSYFLHFESGSRLEIMNLPILEERNKNNKHIGLIHLAFSVGNKDKVDQLTEQLRADGYEVVSNPRTTGDGYYESCVLDPEGNLIEITI
ncbi:glyoxalase [Candidatus Epulonipiscioides gigas]|nr:glyoxalase [Epulopiscium sp. SCG-C07WGA-EpuloA2]